MSLVSTHPLNPTPEPLLHDGEGLGGGYQCSENDSDERVEKMIEDATRRLPTTGEE